MKQKSKASPYTVIKSLYSTEKTRCQTALADGNFKGAKGCNQKKYTFLVDPKATKPQIAQAIEEIYSDKEISVKKVNIICVKSKPTRKRSFGVVGYKSSFKKAIVTLAENQTIEEVL